VIVLVCLEPPQPGRGARAAEILARKLAGVAESVAVCVGGPLDSPSLTWAIDRHSFRRVIHVDDAPLEKTDFMTLGAILAEVARRLGAGVVITGEHSDREGQGLVPAAIAHHLHAPLIARVCELRRSGADPDRLEITTRAGGKLCTLDVATPIVLSTEPASYEEIVPLAATGASAVETLTLPQLGLDADRLVPRPELLGTPVAAPSERPATMTPEEAARFLRPRQ